MNINKLDIRNAKESVLQSIDSISDITTLYTSKELEGIEHIEFRNVFETIYLPQHVRIVRVERPLHITNEFLESYDETIFIVSNDKMFMEENLSLELLKESVIGIQSSHSIFAVEKFRDILQTLCIGNQDIYIYPKEYYLLDEHIIMDDLWLMQLSDGMDIAIQSIQAIEKISEEVFRQKIQNLIVLDHILLTQSNLSIFASVTKDFVKVEKKVLSEGTLYFSRNITIWLDEETTTNEQEKEESLRIMCTGVLTILPHKKGLEKEQVAKLFQRIESIEAAGVITKKSFIPFVKNRLTDKGIPVKKIERNTIENKGKMVLRTIDKEEITVPKKLENYGKFIFADEVNPKDIPLLFERIENKGIIEVSKEQEEVLHRLMVRNMGSIQVRDGEEKYRRKEASTKDRRYKVLYENCSYVVL